jgi:hypothetical protein
MHSINSKTCILSLFEDDKTLIFTKCDFRLLPHMIKQDVFELSPTSVLLTNIDLGNTYFKQSVNITIPDFKIYTHKFKEILASDRNDPLSLKRMVKSAKKDETIFQSLSEPILDGQLQLSQTWP